MSAVVSPRSPRHASVPDHLESELEAELASMTRLDDEQLNALDSDAEGAAYGSHDDSDDDLFAYEPKASITLNYEEDDDLEDRDYSKLGFYENESEQPNEEQDDGGAASASAAVSDDHERWAAQFAERMKEFHQLNEEATIEVSQIRNREKDKGKHNTAARAPISSAAAVPASAAPPLVSPSSPSPASVDPASDPAAVLLAAAVRRAAEREAIEAEERQREQERLKARQEAEREAAERQAATHRAIEEAAKEADRLKQRLKNQAAAAAEERERKARLAAERDRVRVRLERLMLDRLAMEREDAAATEVRRRRDERLRLERLAAAQQRKRENVKRMMGEDKRSAALRRQKQIAEEQQAALRAKFEAMQAAKRAAEQAAAAAERAERRRRMDRERFRCEDDRAVQWRKCKREAEQRELARIKAIEEERIRKLREEEEERIRMLKAAEEERIRRIKREEEEKARRIREAEEERIRKVREAEEERLRMQREAEARAAAERLRLLTLGALVAQRLWRGRLVRLRLPYCRLLKQWKARRLLLHHRRLNAAATRIQSLVRGFLVRSRLERVRQYATAANDYDSESEFAGVDESFYNVDELPEFELEMPAELKAALSGQSTSIPIPPHEARAIEHQQQRQRAAQLRHTKMENNYLSLSPPRHSGVPSLPPLVAPSQRFDSARSDRSVSSSGSVQFLNSPRYSESSDSRRQTPELDLSRPDSQRSASFLPSIHSAGSARSSSTAQQKAKRPADPTRALQNIASAWGLKDPRAAAAILKKQKKLKKMHAAKAKANLTAEERLKKFAKASLVDAALPDRAPLASPNQRRMANGGSPTAWATGTRFVQSNEQDAKSNRK